MGRMILDILGERTGGSDAAPFRVTGAVDRPDCRLIGSEVFAGVTASADLDASLADADVYIDFTTPEATRRAAERAAERGVAAIIGTTGLDQAAERAIEKLAERAPLVAAANFSLGVNVLLGLAERAARALTPGFDAEIVEIHHRHKRDAPSGTALALAAAVAAGSNIALDNRLSREGDVGARSDGELGVLAVRGGDVTGEHTAYFLGPGERLELTHRANSRRIFAEGALHAARWIAGKPAGRYGMSDVLGL